MSSVFVANAVNEDGAILLGVYLSEAKAKREAEVTVESMAAGFIPTVQETELDEEKDENDTGKIFVASFVEGEYTEVLRVYRSEQKAQREASEDVDRMAAGTVPIVEETELVEEED